MIFAGDDLNRAVVEPEARGCLTHFDTHVDHFELVGEVTPLAPGRNSRDVYS